MEDNDIASIWLKLTRRGSKPITIGGVYRKHRLLLQGFPNLTNYDDFQAERWSCFISQWKLASRDNQCFVVGDTNLDMFKWDNPEHVHIPMIQQMNDEVITLNFSQVIEGATRYWPGTQDSLLDQCWTNSP